jgi:hypothetical protein
MSEFDNTYPLEEGLDPTSVWGSYAASLLQMIREARPSTLYGMVIYTTDTPPTTGIKEWHKRSIWIKKPTPPATKYLGWYYDNNTGSWEYLDKLLNTILAAGSVTLAMLDPTAGSALQLLRKNAGNTGHEYVDASSLFTTGSLNVNKLLGTGTSGDRHVLMSIDGVTAYADMSTFFFYLLEESGLRVKPRNISGTDAATGSQAAENTVLSVRAADGALNVVNWRSIVTLLQANTLPFSKMLFPASMAGLAMRVNSAANDIEGFVLTSGIPQKFAILADQKVQGVNGDNYSGAGPHTLTLQTERYDPDNIVTVASNRFTPIAGKYTCDVTVPVYQDGEDMQYIIYIVNVTTAAIIAVTSCTSTDENIQTIWRVSGGFTANGTDEYAIYLKGHADLNVYVGILANVYDENYTEVKLHRYAD